MGPFDVSFDTSRAWAHVGSLSRDASHVSLAASLTCFSAGWSAFPHVSDARIDT